MKKTLLALCLMACCITAEAQSYEITYSKSDSLKVVSLLKDARKQSAETNFVLYFARRMKGLPYVAHTLEVNKTEQLVVNLRQLDCTTLVENVAALCQCVKKNEYTFKAFCDNLKSIRYRNGGNPTYEGRLHYFTDWISDNTRMGLCSEIQSPNPPFTAVQKINVGFMSAHPNKYAMLKASPELVPKIAEAEKNINGKTFRYIPEDKITNTKLLRNTIHDGDIIATTTTLKGLDVQHLGIAVWKKDGLHMLNASSLRHKVVEEPMLLRTYLKRQKSMTGIRIVRLK